MASWIALHHYGVVLGGYAFSILPFGLLKGGSLPKPGSIRKHGKSVVCGVLAALLMCGSFAVLACAAPSHETSEVIALTQTLTPESQTVAPGGTITLTAATSSNTTLFTNINIRVEVGRIDVDTPYAVTWTTHIAAAKDGHTATITITAGDSATAGTYKVTVAMLGNEAFSETATVYVQAKAFDWLLFDLCFFGGLLLAFVSIFGYVLAQRTKTKFDDGAFVVLGIVSVILILLGLAYYFNWIDITFAHYIKAGIAYLKAALCI
jgi:hypothetical protein